MEKKTASFLKISQTHGLSDLLCEMILHSLIKQVLYPVLTDFLLGNVFSLSEKYVVMMVHTTKFGFD